MKKLLFLFSLTIIALSCTDRKHEIERNDIIGEWKEVQRRNATYATLRDVTSCKNDEKGQVFIFTANGKYVSKSQCPNDKPVGMGRWEYRDNVISMTSEKYNIKFSISYVESGKIKFSQLLYTEEGITRDLFDVGFYSILEKQ